tara:strand:- start:197 stop:373 length:177 start_codon:yes stop_codon:yes gene_type:complete
MFISVEKKYDYGEFGGYLVVKEDGTRWAVPLDEANKDYQEIQKWIANGGTIIDNGGEE